MYESDADRLASLVALGGLRVRAERGELLAIFDRQYEPTTLGDSSIVASGPVATCRSSDVSRLELARGASVMIDQDRYRVVDVRPDGTGITVLTLEEV